MSSDNRSRLKEMLQSGEIRLQPLTLPQRELWECSPVPAGDVSNHICAFIHLRGVLTPQTGAAALQRVVQRQEVFRISFLPGKDQPLQMIRSTGKARLNFRELTPAESRPEAIEDMAQEIFRRPFDMLAGPLYRAEMLQCGPNEHVLVFAIHHAIADGWTLGVFVQDLFAAYLAELKQSSSRLPELPLSYTDWGASERSFWQSAELEKRADFWKKSLADSRRLWEAKKNSDGSSNIPERSVTFISTAVARGVRDLARRNGATLFSTLLSAFQIALSKWSGGDDILVGTPVANRTKQTMRETMGYCAGIVPLRCQIDRSKTFSDHLCDVHQTTVECFANAMPFVELCRALGDKPSSGYNPIFQVRFALQNHPVPDIEIPGFSLKLRMRSTGTARFDLACEITEEGESLEVVWLFRHNLFSREDMQNLDRIFQSMVADACHSPEMMTASLMTSP